MTIKLEWNFAPGRRRGWHRAAERQRTRKHELPCRKTRLQAAPSAQHARVHSSRLEACATLVKRPALAFPRGVTCRRGVSLGKSESGQNPPAPLPP